MSNIKNIAVDQGSSDPFTFTLTNVDGSKFDLNGFDARLQVRRSYGDTTVLINCTLANSKLIMDVSAGTVVWNITPTDTSSIRFNNKDDDTLECVYDLEIVSPASKVYKPAKGTFTINREVTRQFSKDK